MLAKPKARASVHPLLLNSAQVEIYAGSGLATKNWITKRAATAINIQMAALETAVSTPVRTELRERAARNPAIHQDVNITSIKAIGRAAK